MSTHSRNSPRDMLMGYCFVVLGVFFGLNAQTVLQQFGGAWFAIFLVLHAIFVGIIIHNYMQRDVILRSRLTSIVEILYLSWIGLFSTTALNIIQVIVGYIVNYDPHFTISKMFIPITSIPNSTLNSFQSSVMLSLSNWLFYTVLGYFGALIALYYIRKSYQWKDFRDSERAKKSL